MRKCRKRAPASLQRVYNVIHYTQTNPTQARSASTQASAPFLASRSAIAGATALSVGSVAWYAHLYGNLPFLPAASANSAADDGLHPANYPFEHKGWFETFNHASIRRGYQGALGDDFGNGLGVAVMEAGRGIGSKGMEERSSDGGVQSALQICVGNTLTPQSTAKSARHATRSTVSHGATWSV